MSTLLNKGLESLKNDQGILHKYLFHIKTDEESIHNTEIGKNAPPE